MVCSQVGIRKDCAAKLGCASVSKAGQTNWGKKISRYYLGNCPPLMKNDEIEKKAPPKPDLSFHSSSIVVTFSDITHKEADRGTLVLRCVTGVLQCVTVCSGVLRCVMGFFWNCRSSDPPSLPYLKNFQIIPVFFYWRLPLAQNSIKNKSHFLCC